MSLYSYEDTFALMHLKSLIINFFSAPVFESHTHRLQLKSHKVTPIFMCCNPKWDWMIPKQEFKIAKYAVKICHMECGMAISFKITNA